jgi:PAS domain S-box-containing protein
MCAEPMVSSSDDLNIPRQFVSRRAEGEALSLLAAIVEFCDDAIVSASMDGAITSWNGGAERMFGFTAVEAIGRPSALLFRDSRESETARDLAGLWKGQRIGRYEAVRCCKDGRKIPVTVTVSPIRDVSNRLVGLSEISRRVPEQEAGGRRARTQDKMAALGRFASRIAHDINNPLSSIMNLLFLLQKESLSEQGAEYVALAQCELMRIAQVSVEALGLYRVSAEPVLYSMVTILDEAIAAYHDRIRSIGITVLRENRPAPLISCHVEELRRAILSLVGNALDAMSPGGTLRLRVRTANDWTTRRSCLLITLGDNGTGMSAETRSRLFEPFLTSKGTTESGLELWQCAHVVTKYGGRILVRSSDVPGHSGSVFMLFLPL